MQAGKLHIQQVQQSLLALRSVKYMLAAVDAACMYAAMLWQVLHKVPAVCHSFVTQVEKLMLDSS